LGEARRQQPVAQRGGDSIAQAIENGIAWRRMSHVRPL